MLKRTPLHDWHVAHGARMVEFAGWEMPVQYTSVVEEHNAVRTAVGLFDVSHMGEIRVRGRGALPLLQHLVTNDVSRLSPARALYTPMCREDGGTLDDLLIYHLGEDDYLAVVNAANTERDLAWFRAHAEGAGDVDVLDETDRWALFAVQGPRAEEVLQPLVEADLKRLRYYHCIPGTSLAGVSGAIVARTGYTGEDGFECYLPAGAVHEAWEAVWGRVQALNGRLCGLGARDTLRLEAALPLYGHELTETINPLEARLGAFVKLEKGPFIGREALAAAKAEGPRRRLCGLRLLERGIPRAGYAVHRASAGGPDGSWEAEPCGYVTSGTFAPYLHQPIALALVGGGAAPGERMAVDIRGRLVPAEVVPLPFYKRGAAAPGS
ncbi:MAG: glycine cleavage system aminomethyltransferase GcvT [Firmicutes bacterium]|nr:glycine cleavage system aminomethyltransferase GcvT [Bacillota bacterium]